MTILTFGGDCGGFVVAISSVGDDYRWPEVANFSSGGDYMVTAVGLSWRFKLLEVTTAGLKWRL